MKNAGALNRRAGILFFRAPQGMSMIRNFAEHSANERTFLAWMRTGIAVIAFGFVIEKFNLFILALAASASAEVGKAISTGRFTGPLARYEGLAFMLTGVTLLGLGCWRFLRTQRLIDEAAPSATGGVRTEIAITIILMVLVTAYCVSVLLR